MALPYEAHRVDIMAGDQFTDEFVAINPNSKIPAIVDPKGPGGESISVFESGAILIYLAEKSGQYLPTDPVASSECLQWLFFQVGGVEPMFGLFCHFYTYAKEKIPYRIKRYQTEVKRLLGVLEMRFQGQDYLVRTGYTIADMATFPWVGALDWGYNAVELLQNFIFKTETADAPGWEERQLTHSRAGTDILAEHYDSSDNPPPQPGDRLPEFHRVPGFEDPQFSAASTHSREGNWQITRIEEYRPTHPNSAFHTILLCYCQYTPIVTSLEPLPPVQVTADSFGSDETAHQDWQTQQTQQPVEV